MRKEDIHHEGKSLLLVHNFSEQPHQAVIRSVTGSLLIDLVNSEDQNSNAGAFHIRLDGYGYRWFRVK